MKLYTSPLACSCAVHMILIELGMPHEIKYVDIYVQPHILVGDQSLYTEINPKGSVPALELDSGEILTEVGVIMQYLVDQQKDSDLLPKAGTIDRYRVMEWLSYIGSDVHKTIGPLFNPLMPETAKEIHKQNLNRRLKYINDKLAHSTYLSGEKFTIADAYLFIMMGWRPYLKFDFNGYPNLVKFHEKVSERSSFVKLKGLLSTEYAKVNLPAFD